METSERRELASLAYQSIQRHANYISENCGAQDVIQFNAYLQRMFHDIRLIFQRSEKEESELLNIITAVGSEVLFEYTKTGRIKPDGTLNNSDSSAFALQCFSWRLGILISLLSAQGNEYSAECLIPTARLIRFFFPQSSTSSFNIPEYNTFETIIIKIADCGEAEFLRKIKNALFEFDKDNNTNTIKEKSSHSSNVGLIEKYKNQLQGIIDSLVQDPSIDKNVKVNLVIHATALICALVAIQPLPFADIFILTPIQLVMVTALNKILDNPFEKSSIKEVLSSLLVVIGWGTLAQHVILGLYKTILPFLGAVTTIPLVYAATFALGTAAKVLIAAKKNDQTVTDEELKRIFKEAREEESRNHKGMSLSDMLSEIKKMTERGDAYIQYKHELLELNDKISIALSDEIAERTDIGSLIEKRITAISRRLKDYNNVSLSDYSISLLSLLDGNVFIEIAEPIIGEINFNLQKMDLLSCVKFSNGSFYELNTRLGRFFIKQKRKIDIISFELASPYSDAPVIKYMKVDKSNIKMLKDTEIRNAFHDMIRSAHRNLCIISPWVGGYPFYEVSKLMRKSVEDNPDIDIQILYGINDESQKSKNTRKENSDNYIQKYKQLLGNNLRTREDNTHVKLVLCDDACYLLGSMNVLSFSANYKDNQNLHHELATYAFDTNLVAELKEAYFKW